MSRLGWLLALTLFLPQTSSAIQLRWSDGSSNLTFGTAHRCTLIVQADAAEGALPGQWRLLWLADSSGIAFVEEDSVAACSADTARVSTIAPPATTADSAAHEITTRFCSANEAAASVAIFVLDQPGWSKGKLKVVAINPSDPDSNEVIESNEVTYNGGVEGTYAPNILATTQSRQSNTVLVEALGTGLNGLSRARIVAPDTSWTVPLNVLSQTGTSLAAAAEVPASLPAAVLELSKDPGLIASAPVSGDVPVAPLVDYSYGSFFSPDPTVWRPKDFSLFYDGLGHFHIFFMRQETGGPTSVQRSIGHVTGQDLRNWSSVDLTLESQSSGWDSRFVWAPFLLPKGPTYYLFYTGVNNANGNQTIGVTTTSDLNAPGGITWGGDRTSSIWDVNQTSWARKPASNQQCRDPFVMKSAFTGRYWMFFTSERDIPGTGIVPAIGLASTSDPDFRDWNDEGYLEIGEVTTGMSGTSGKAESMHAFLHINRHVNASPPIPPPDTTYFLLGTSSATAPRITRMLRNRQSPWDHGTSTDSEHWFDNTENIFDALGFDPRTPDNVYDGWEATEYCNFIYGAYPGFEGQHEYLAGINYTPNEPTTAAIWIVMLNWTDGGAGIDGISLRDVVTAVEHPVSCPVQANGLRLVGRSPGTGPLSFEMALMSAEPVELAVYDAQGRRIQTVASGQHPAGRHVVSWDGRDHRGYRVGSGVYFARMKWPSGQSVTRCLVLR